MEQAQWKTINEKQNELEQSKNEKSSTLQDINLHITKSTSTWEFTLIII